LTGLVFLGLTLTLAFGFDASRGAPLSAMPAYAFGTPQVVLTRPQAIGVAGWLSDQHLRLVLYGTDAPQTALFDAQTGRLTPTNDRWTRQRTTDAVATQRLDAQWSPNGRLRAAILTPGARAGAPLPVTQLQILDAATGQTRTWEDAPRFVTDLAWAPDGRWLAVLAVTEITADGAERAQLFLVDAITAAAYLAREESFGGGTWGEQLAWSPDGRWLAAACPTEEIGRLCLLPVAEAPLSSAPWRPTQSESPFPPPRRAQAAAYTPPTNITLEVYVLTLGGARRQPYTLCGPGSTAWGCTVFCDETGYPCAGTYLLPYPYATNPITIPIESDYLLDVVPLEMGPYYHQTALIAQAAAARSYAYSNLYEGRTINNSTAFQAFIPYKFESLPPAQFPDTPNDPCASSNLNDRQRIVCNAVAPGYYIAYDLAPDNYVPAFAEFSADAWLRTVDGSRPYLRGVADPISSGCDANDYGHQRGMSQEGASRWARGNRCSYAGRGDDPWSVRWEDARQILTHYYTGIQLRDSAGARLTPDYRWVPLEIDWGGGRVTPPLFQPEQTHTITFTVQNAGVVSWTGRVALAYDGWEDEGGIPVVTATTVVTIPQTVLPGGSVRVTIPLTSPAQVEPLRRYRLRFDMLLYPEEGPPVGFSLREPERPWPRYEVELTVLVLPYKTYLPLMLQG